MDKIDFTRMRNETIASPQMLLKPSRIPACTLPQIDIFE